MNTLRIYKSRTGFRWTYLHRNGRKLANGGQGYSRKADLVKALKKVFSHFCDGKKIFVIWSIVPGVDPKVRVKDETTAKNLKPQTRNLLP